MLFKLQYSLRLLPVTLHLSSPVITNTSPERLQISLSGFLSLKKFSKDKNNFI